MMTMNTLDNRSGSSSREQQDVEVEILLQYAKELNLENKTAELKKEFNVEIDGVFFGPDRIYLVEVWAHIGKAKPAQKSKISRDMLKLIYIEKKLINSGIQKNQQREIVKQLFFVDDEAKNTSIGKKSWNSAVASEFCFDLITREISGDTYEQLQEVQGRQAKSNEKKF